MRNVDVAIRATQARVQQEYALLSAIAAAELRTRDIPFETNVADRDYVVTVVGVPRDKVFDLETLRSYAAQIVVCRGTLTRYGDTAVPAAERVGVIEHLLSDAADDEATASSSAFWFPEPGRLYQRRGDSALVVEVRSVSEDEVEWKRLNQPDEDRSWARMPFKTFLDFAEPVTQEEEQQLRAMAETEKARVQAQTKGPPPATPLRDHRPAGGVSIPGELLQRMEAAGLQLPQLPPPEVPTAADDGPTDDWQQEAEDRLGRPLRTGEEEAFNPNSPPTYK